MNLQNSYCFSYSLFCKLYIPQFFFLLPPPQHQVAVILSLAVNSNLTFVYSFLFRVDYINCFVNPLYIAALPPDKPTRLSFSVPPSQLADLQHHSTFTSILLFTFTNSLQRLFLTRCNSPLLQLAITLPPITKPSQPLLHLRFRFFVPPYPSDSIFSIDPIAACNDRVVVEFAATRLVLCLLPSSSPCYKFLSHVDC